MFEGCLEGRQSDAERGKMKFFFVPRRTLNFFFLIPLWTGCKKKGKKLLSIPSETDHNIYWLAAWVALRSKVMAGKQDRTEYPKVVSWPALIPHY